MKISDSQMFQKTKVQDQWLCPPLRWAQGPSLQLRSWPHHKSWDALWRCPPWPAEDAEVGPKHGNAKTSEKKKQGPKVRKWGWFNPHWPKSEVRHQTKGSAWNSTMVLPAILNGWPRQVWSQWGCLSKPVVALPRVSLGYTLGMCRGYKWTHQLVSSRPRLISAFQSIRVRAISFP